MPENVNTSELVINQAEEAEDNRPVMIKVDHVSMSFNMASEQMNSLKEYAVALAKRKLFFEEFKALDDVSFEVRKGDVFGIMGTNGSGKSTMLKIIAGVLEPTKGTCQVNGNIAPLIELGAGFDMDLSARENIYLNGALLGYSKQFIDENFDAIVEFAEVEKFLDMPLKNYSSGMVARIAFAIATVIVPEILVVDEVLSVGDFMFQKKCEDRITELIEQHGVTVLIVSHSNEQIARLCNRAIWIEKGHERLQGDAETVCGIYGGLGGRTGSPEAEGKVFNALVDASRGPNVDAPVYRGENGPSTCIGLINDIWKNGDCDAAVVVSNLSHVNSVVAHPLAGFLQAPVIPTDSSRLSDSAKLFLSEKKPKEIYFFDCGNHSPEILTALSGLAWNPKVISFNESNSLSAFSWGVFSYGVKEGIWGSSLVISEFSSNYAALCCTPFLYRSRTPIVIVEDGSISCAVEEAEKTCGLNSLMLLGLKAGLGEIHRGLKIACLDGSDMGSLTLNVARYMCEHLAIDGRLKTLYLSSMSSAQWPDLLSAGCVSLDGGAALALVDQTSLDSMAGVMELVSRYGVEDIRFIGGSVGLTSLERSVFLRSVPSNRK